MPTRPGAHTRAEREQSLAEVRARRAKALPPAPTQATLDARALYAQAQLCPRRQQRQEAAQAAFVKASQAINAKLDEKAKGGRPSHRMGRINVEKSRSDL